MANYYRILSAFSASGDDLFIPVPWNFDDISDISVVVAGTNGSPSICNYWKWNSQLHQVEIENTQNFSQWYAYVSRKEDASTLLQLVEGFVVNPQNIVEQFQKINRLIESLQEDSKTSLRSPDYIDALIPNANGRKNSFLSFDENGNPSCNIPVETFQDAVGFMEEAVANAEDSFDEFVSQKTSEFNSNAASKKEEINTLAAQAETSKNAAITAANGATAAAQAAEASKEEAAASKTSAEESATEAQGFAQAAASSQTAAQQAAQIAQATDAGKLALDKLSAGTLYFNNAKLFGSNFAIPNFPFSICATVRVDSWEGSTQGIQTIFQFGNNGTGALWGAIYFGNIATTPRIALRISKNTDGALSYSEIFYTLNTDTFLGKEHTIIGVCRELESTPVNFDIYVDGTKVATSPYKGLTLDSLSGTVNYAVNTYNANYSVQPASAHPMMLRNLYVFNFDVSAPAAPYSIADYVAGRLIPPALKPSQVSLALENYTIARNATTKLVKDASGNSNDATVQGSGTVAGDNDQSIKAFVDEIKTQINQSNG